MLAIRFMSPAVASMILTLMKGPAPARELAEVARVESKHVYPYLRYWIFRGVVAVSKVMAGINLYSLSEEVRKAVGELKRYAEELLQSVKGKKSPRKIMEEAEKRYRERFGKEMGEVHRLILGIFIEHALSKSSPYIAVKPGEETLPQILRTMIVQRFGRDLDIDEVIEVLRELELAKVIYIDRKRFKARLDRSLL